MIEQNETSKLLGFFGFFFFLFSLHLISNFLPLKIYWKTRQQQSCPERKGKGEGREENVRLPPRCNTQCLKILHTAKMLFEMKVCACAVQGRLLIGHGVRRTWHRCYVPVCLPDCCTTYCTVVATTRLIAAVFFLFIYLYFVYLCIFFFFFFLGGEREMT